MFRMSCALIVALGVVASNPGEKRRNVAVPHESTGAYKIPNIDKIKEIRAECHGWSFLGDAIVPEVRPFSVPRKDWKRILSFFQAPQVDTRPITFHEVGLLRIYAKNGQRWSIPYYHSGDMRPLMFSVQGIRCLDGNSEDDVDAGLAFDSILRVIYERKTGHIVTKPFDPR